MGANLNIPVVPPGVFDPKLRNPINRQVAIRKQRVYLWRRHILLGKTYAFRRTTSLCRIWLSCLALSLFLLSAIWSHLLANNGSLWYITVTFPLDFMLMVVVVLDEVVCKVIWPPFLQDTIEHHRIKKVRITILGPIPKPVHLGQGVVNWDSDAMNFDTQLQETLDVRTTALLAEKLQQYLEDEGDINHDSDDDDEEHSVAGSSETETGQKSHKVDSNAVGSEWFPWPDKENAAIHWAMLALGLQDLPSDRVMDDIDKYLQKMCGVQSIRYSGKLGHVYNVNDLAALIAQVGLSFL
ncbi:hypothetical protein B0H10DRAFT_1956369 [Mycena sp. CBHHK59/15]|nr:hypothetical protein B0H10DRAFT_1956369 [Mycena sp. CBHHK59/15]